MRRLLLTGMAMMLLATTACRVRTSRPAADSTARSRTAAASAADTSARRDSVGRDSTATKEEEDPPCLASHLGLPCSS